MSNSRDRTTKRTFLSTAAMGAEAVFTTPLAESQAPGATAGASHEQPFPSLSRRAARLWNLSNDSNGQVPIRASARRTASLSNRRRGLVGLVLVAVAFWVGHSSVAADQQGDVPVMTIRVLDYAQIPADSMAEAQRLVTEIFGAIGVRTRWLETRRPAERLYGEPAPDHDPKEFPVIVLSPSMSQRQMASEDTVGNALVIRCGPGRAYVSFDRVRRVASAFPKNEMEVMGLVMAHELGHLLLPPGAHSHTGLMRAHWDVRDLQAFEHADFEFTAAQAALIREALRRSSGARSTDCPPAESASH